MIALVKQAGEPGQAAGSAFAEQAVVAAGFAATVIGTTFRSTGGFGAARISARVTAAVRLTGDTAKRLNPACACADASMSSAKNPKLRFNIPEFS